MTPTRRSNTTHQQAIARALGSRLGIGYQQALQRVREGAAAGLLPSVLDAPGRERAVEILATMPPTPRAASAAVEADTFKGVLVDATTGELVEGDDATAWTAQQQTRRWEQTALGLRAVQAALEGRAVRRVVDLGCGTGELTAGLALLWPDAEIVAVDRSELMTLMTMGELLAVDALERSRVITADVAGPLEIEAGSADLVLASCIGNNMLNALAGHCPDGGTDLAAFALWYHAWQQREMPLLTQARRLLAPDGLLVSVEPNNHEYMINAWSRILAGAGFAVDGGLSRPIEWECDCGCAIPLLVARQADGDVDRVAAPFNAWLPTVGSRFKGQTAELDPAAAERLRTAGEIALDLSYDTPEQALYMRVTRVSPFLVFESNEPDQGRTMLCSDGILDKMVSVAADTIAWLDRLHAPFRLSGSHAQAALAAATVPADAR